MREHGRSGLSWERLRQRADLMAAIRAYFAACGVVEVDTPSLRITCASDPHIPALAVGEAAEPEFLQSSPEALMKCLLAEHGRPIYQLGKVYRAGELGRLHQPEFTMLEWYRPGWSMQNLMDEVVAILRLVEPAVTQVDTVDWRSVFVDHTGLEPEADRHALAQRAAGLGVSRQLLETADPRALRDLLFSHCVQPTLGQDRPVFVTGFPAEEAAFARLDPADDTRALRFELYWAGVELANGGEELTELDAWRRRASADLEYRRRAGLPVMAIDADWVAALELGLPAASGVALGVDRLLMCALGANAVGHVMPFARD